MRTRALLIVEALFVLAALVGVWFIFWPAALIIGGVLGALACERATSSPTVANKGQGAGR